MPHRPRGVALALAVALAAGAACGSAAPGPRAVARIKTGTSHAGGDPASAFVQASDQTGDGRGVLIDTIRIPRPGYAAVQRDEAGHPGAVLGVSDVLPAGVSRQLIVRLDEPLTRATTVWAVARLEGDGDREFDAAHDLPATTGGTDVAVAVRVIVRT